MKTERRKILITGFGIVAQALLPMLEKRLRMEPKDITVIDFLDRRRVLCPWTERGLRFVRERATPLSVSLPLRDFLVPVRSRR